MCRIGYIEIMAYTWFTMHTLWKLNLLWSQQRLFCLGSTTIWVMWLCEHKVVNIKNANGCLTSLCVSASMHTQSQAEIKRTQNNELTGEIVLYFFSHSFILYKLDHADSQSGNLHYIRVIVTVNWGNIYTSN